MIIWRGYNHIKSNKICEDYSDYYDDGEKYICVVADGHGSDDYPRTDKGSKMAVECAIDCTKEFIDASYTDNDERSISIEDILKDEKRGFPLLMMLAKSILLDWHKHVDDHFNANPFTVDELKNVSEKYKLKYSSQEDNDITMDKNYYKAYGCTLILYAITDKYSFGLQIGDGKCIVIDGDGQFSEPIPWDDNCQLNVTTSICDNDASNEFRFFVTEEKPAAVFCGSDGIDDSYASIEELHALYRSIISVFAEHGEEIGKKEIKEYLPVLTQKGSGDDVSIGLIINMDMVKGLTQVLDIQSKLFNLEKEEKEKMQQLNTNIEKEEALSNRIKKWHDSKALLKKNIRDDNVKLKEIHTLKRNLENDIKVIGNQSKKMRDALLNLLSDLKKSAKNDMENKMEDNSRGNIT